MLNVGAMGLVDRREGRAGLSQRETGGPMGVERWQGKFTELP